jgi:hypothetical protein
MHGSRLQSRQLYALVVIPASLQDNAKGKPSNSPITEKQRLSHQDPRAAKNFRGFVAALR